MAKKSNILHTFISVIAVVMLLVLIVGGLGFFAKFTNNFSTGFSSFYVNVNGVDKLVGENKVFELANDKDIKFDCKNAFSATNDMGFSVKVLANVNKENDFEFFVDNNSYAFSGEKDFTNIFNVKKFDNHFSVNISSGFTMKRILQNTYKKTVTFDGEIDTLKTSYFKIVVTSADGKNVVNIPITFHSELVPDELTVDKGAIAF